MSNKILLFISLFLYSTTAFSQQVDTVAAQPMLISDAIAIALEQNYSIRIASNEQQKSDNNAEHLYTTLLPTASVGLELDGSNASSEKTFNDGDYQEQPSGYSKDLVSDVAIDWVVFDGFKMFATYEKTLEFQKMGELSSKVAILQTIYDVQYAYYDLVTQQRRLKTLSDALDLSRKRSEEAKNKYSYGKASRLDVLNSMVDFNSDTSSFIQQELAVQEAQISLNKVLASDNLMNKVLTIDTIPVVLDLNYETMKSNTLENNLDLKMLIMQKNIANLTYKETRGERFPEVALNGSYEYGQGSSNYGSVMSDSRSGFYYGATVRMNVFNGLHQNRREKNAKADIKNAELNYLQQKQELEAMFNKAFINYQNNIRIIALEKANLDLAKQNQNITIEKYKIGAIPSIELRQAQQNFVNADYRYMQALFEAKLAEISLRLLEGKF